MSTPTDLQTLQTGVARTEISPPVGIRSVGFAARGPLTAFHDPLFATTMVVQSGSTKAGLVACDLLGLDAETVDEIRTEVAHRCSIPRDHLTVACTHTHYGPDPYRDLTASDVRAYRANLIFKIAGTIEEADRSLEPVCLGIRWGESHIGINRREKLADGRVILGNNPSGPIDRAVGVLRLDTVTGKPLACLVNFQTHPVCQRGTTSHISSDYVGKMREIVESLTGARCLFLQGACGDINPIRMEPEYEPARTLGTRLGCEVVRLWETIEPGPAEGLAVKTGRVHLPRIRYQSQEEAVELVESLQAEIDRATSEGAQPGLTRWAQSRLERAQAAVESWKTGQMLEPLETELQAWRIEEMAMVTTPGEIFNQIGEGVKEASPFENTFFLGYANDSIGYVPVPEAYPDGGYEVMRASQVDPGAAGILTESCLQLLQSLVDQ
jgi:neutral ceramidase